MSATAGGHRACATAEYGRGVWYNPEATVAHKVFDYRTDPRWLLDRAFWQGYSKRAMEHLAPGSGDEENDFLGKLLFTFAPQRAKDLFDSPSKAKLLQLIMLFVFTGFVGCGYLYGATKYR